jgi:hypothetical protein
LELPVERIDLRLQILIRGEERIHELVLFDRLDFVAEVQVCVGEEARGDDVAGVELQGPVQRVDGLAVLLLIAQHAAEAHPGGEIGGMNGQAGAEDLFGVVHVSGLSQFLGERIEKTALRVGFDLEPKLFDLRTRRWLRHRGP